MRLTSSFDDKIQKEGSCTDKISLFMDEYTDRLEERVHQDIEVANTPGANGHGGDEDIGAAFATLMTGMRVVQLLLTDRAEHDAIRYELVQMCALSRRDIRLSFYHFSTHVLCGVGSWVRFHWFCIYIFCAPSVPSPPRTPSVSIFGVDVVVTQPAPPRLLVRRTLTAHRSSGFVLVLPRLGRAER